MMTTATTDTKPKATIQAELRVLDLINKPHAAPWMTTATTSITPKATTQAELRVWISSISPMLHPGIGPVTASYCTECSSPGTEEESSSCLRPVIRYRSCLVIGADLTVVPHIASTPCLVRSSEGARGWTCEEQEALGKEDAEQDHQGAVLNIGTANLIDEASVVDSNSINVQCNKLCNKR